jgi:hypothetical protein
MTCNHLSPINTPTTSQIPTPSPFKPRPQAPSVQLPPAHASQLVLLLVLGALRSRSSAYSFRVFFAVSTIQCMRQPIRQLYHQHAAAAATAITAGPRRLSSPTGRSPNHLPYRPRCLPLAPTRTAAHIHHRMGFTSIPIHQTLYHVCVCSLHHAVILGQAPSCCRFGQQSRTLNTRRVVPVAAPQIALRLRGSQRARNARSLSKLQSGAASCQSADDTSKDLHPISIG